LNTWGHDQAGGKKKTHGRTGSIILILRKILGRIGNILDKGWRTRKYDNIKPFQEAKVII
jgi:hypothetical protein